MFISNYKIIPTDKFNSTKGSPVRETETFKAKHYIRSTYNNYQKDLSNQEPIKKETGKSQESIKPNSGFKTASLRRRQGQDMPVQFDPSKNRQANRYDYISLTTNWFVIPLI